MKMIDKQFRKQPIPRNCKSNSDFKKNPTTTFLESKEIDGLYWCFSDIAWASEGLQHILIFNQVGCLQSETRRKRENMAGYK